MGLMDRLFGKPAAKPAAQRAGPASVQAYGAPSTLGASSAQTVRKELVRVSVREALLHKPRMITIDPWTQKTSVPGIWAAGDCTNVKYHQNNISAGDAVRALEDIYVHWKTK